MAQGYWAKKAANIKRCAKERGARVERTTGRDLREIFVKRYGRRCAYCSTILLPDASQKHPRKLTWDHAVPIVAGGVHAPHNLVPACPGCQQTKGRKEQAFARSSNPADNAKEAAAA